LSSIIPLSEIISETTSPTKLEEYPEVPRITSSTIASLSTTPAATTSTSTEVITVISVEPPENSSSINPKIGSTTDSMKLVEDSVTEILFTTLPTTSSTNINLSQPTTTTTTTTTLASRSTTAAVSQPRPFGFPTRRRSNSSEVTTTATTPLSRSKVSITSRNPTRPSNPILGRGRLRTKSINRNTEEELVDQVDTPHAETSASRNFSRSRSRGSNRYTPPTSKSRQDGSTNSVPSSRYRERGRTTASTTVTATTNDNVRKRYRRPSRNNNTESIKANELDDSQIVRITQGSSRRNPFRSRSDTNEENDQITNIRVFRKPTNNYDRTRYTRKRNNVEEPLQKVNDESNQKHFATMKIPKTDTSVETDRIERNDLLNGVDQSIATVNSVIESNTIQPIHTVKPIAQIGVTTVSSNKVEYTRNRHKDAVATTTAHIETHEFNPNLVTIVSTEHATDVEEKILGAPRKRKIFLRRRPISSTIANITETEEEERFQVPRRRKVIKHKRPLQDTSSTSVEISVKEKEDSSFLLESTTPIGNDKGVEKSTAVINQTEIISMTQNAEESTIAIGLTGFTKEMEDSTLTTETTLSADYNTDSFMKVTLETPATETTTISGEKDTNIFSTATISTISIDADGNRQSTIEIDTEATTMESTLATATIYNTEGNVFLEDTLIPSTEAENLSTIRMQTTTSDSDSVITRAQATTTPFTTESDLLSAARSSIESRYTRKKFIRKTPVSSSEISSNRHSSALSPTENSSLEILSKRRNNLFIRRHPSSSSTANTLHDDLKYQEEEEKEENIEGRSSNLVKQNIAEDTIPKNSSVSTSFSDDSAEFWKHYTTTSLRSQINYPSVRIEDIENHKVAKTEFAEDNTYQSTSIATREPEIQSRYKVPIILKRPFDPEEALSPRRYPPLDSASEESEETSETRETRLRQSGFRQPRMRYRLRDRDNIRIEEETTQPNSEFTSTWQYFKTRSYPKRPSTSTEVTVTETLIPAKKFDYAADAFYRKQQSLRTTTPRSNDLFDSQNLIDPYYMHTTVKPSVTRLVTSVTESGTTERQKILIKTKYSSLTSTTKIPADQFLSTTPLSVSVAEVNDDESANEIRQGIERSTLPIEGEFNYRYDGRFTTESHESSTIEIESVFNNLITGKSFAK